MKAQDAGTRPDIRGGAFPEERDVTLVLGESIVMNRGSPELERKLGERGYKVFETDLSEFIKSGGSAKCLTLSLDG